MFKVAGDGADLSAPAGNPVLAVVLPVAELVSPTISDVAMFIPLSCI
jgi:hypothetical protein